MRPHNTIQYYYYIHIRYIYIHTHTHTRVRGTGNMADGRRVYTRLQGDHRKPWLLLPVAAGRRRHISLQHITRAIRRRSLSTTHLYR